MESATKSEGEDAESTVIESTATDARQRMLKLFPDKTPMEESTEQPATRAINIKPPKRIISADEEDESEDDDEEIITSKPATGAINIRPPREFIPAKDDGDVSAPPKFDVQPFGARPPVSKDSIPNDDEDKSEKLRPASSFSNTPTRHKDENDESIVKRDVAFTRSSRISQKKGSNDSDKDDVKDDDKNIKLPSKSHSSILDRTSHLNDVKDFEDELDTDDEDEQLAHPSQRTTAFSSPTFKTSKFTDENDDEDEEDEQLIRPSANKSPFALPASKTSILTGKKDDEDEPVPATPHRTGLFTTLNQPTSSKGDPTSEEGEDEDDEQLPRTRQPSSLLSTLNQSEATKPIKSTKDTEEESLASRLTGKSQSSTTEEPEDAIASFFNTYKPSSASQEEEDKDKEQGDSSSILSGLGRPTTFIRKPTVMGQRPRPVPKPTSKDDEDDEDESLGSDWRSRLSKASDIKYEPIEDYEYDDDDDDYFDDDDDDDVFGDDD